MPDAAGDKPKKDEIPHVESTLFAGLVRVRQLDQNPGVVLDTGEVTLGPVPAFGIGEAGSRPRYVLKDEIGRGGMGVVYRVVDTDLHRTLAMKVALGAGEQKSKSDSDSDPSLLERFLEEAQVTGQLDHPGVVPLHELGIDSTGRVYFTMRLVRGRHLGEIFEISRRGEAEWSRERVLIALVRVCEAMAYAHTKGVVHRDLKPANVMAGRFGEVYVMDWGLAKVRGRGKERERAAPSAERTQVLQRKRRGSDRDDGVLETGHGTIFGTPAYMSPEQGRGEIDRIDARSDIYSLGAILYQYLTGGVPYSHAGAKVGAEIVLKWLLDGPPAPVKKLAPGTPPELVAICEKAMARDPEQRYQDMGEMAEDLRGFLAGRSVSALPLGPIARVLRWGRRNRLAAGLLVAVTAGSLYGIWRLASLGTDLVRRTALDSAAMKAEILQDVNALYSSAVVARVDQAHVEVTHDYAQKAGAIPLPATFLMDLGEKISKQQSGVIVRQYSDYPFKFRKGGTLDEFEESALAKLRADPSTPVYSFEDYEGNPTLRYAIGRRMEASCVACHNTHEASTKKDWKVGDVRGVLEIVRPLDADVARMRSGLRGTLLVVAAIVGGLMLVSAIGIIRQASQTGLRPKD